ncbi:ribosome maturation factor RimM [Leptothoe sp. LEGE 181152]|uniref:Ribosome maturation factor RimM n=1 Tax=Adonisia turfae CCMR0081 TaxID=2292702 RepID=A0A6M0RL42_9CYAN|nr:ribosome maturation factor RimM [Adonisia turfae]MDV3347473.1 ribosome maturation factor RimM [Leptothoe sp. LEGE 181152]NEZ56610.1 ribosome maturation factor RimM [Adonisia turfae CCMR0081]
MPNNSQSPIDWLTIGRIVGAHGLNGEVRVYPDSDFPERFEQPGERWLLKPGAANPEPIKLVKGRFQEGKGLYILKLAGINYRNQAEILRDAQLLIPADDRLPLEPGEFHVGDLMGLAVILQETGEQIGSVIDVYRAGNDLLEVALASDQPEEATKDNGQIKARTVLIPFVEAIVPVVDLTQGRVEITPPDGLID